MQAGKLVARQTSKQIDKTERQSIRQTDRPSPFMNLGPQMAKIMVDNRKGAIL